MWVHWGLREENKIWGVLVEYSDDVGQGGAVGPCLLNVDDEELESIARQEGV